MVGRSLLKVRLLGELRLVRGKGPALTLPASRKTRALLGYLIATGQSHRRERLCGLFWDGPDDPRAELRWSLSKIRPLLDAGEARLIADRDRVSIELQHADVDLLSVKALLGKSVAAAPTEALKQATALFAGEFLDGLDLPGCYLFQEWCMAEREAVSRLRLDVLSALVDRLQDKPEDALSYARALTVSDPLSEAGHAAVVRLLSRTGRHREALAHYEHARRLFEAELGAPPAEELEEARRSLQDVSVRASAEPAVVPVSVAAKPSVSAAFYAVGRDVEFRLIEGIVAKTAKRQNEAMILVNGEAGIGKTHLLSRAVECMIAAGGVAWSGRAFEPEVAHPYGIWFDILRAITAIQPRNSLPPDLGLLLPEVGAESIAVDRTRLFDAVLRLLRQVAAQRPVVIAFDDIQWIDEASSSLLHYVARHLDAAAGVLLICGARTGELEDNAGTSAVLRSLSRDKRVQTIDLRPLGRGDTIELVRQADPALDGERIFAESEGNPLFTLELVRAHARGEVEPGPTVGAVIASQLGRLSDQAREVLLWAAANGRAFEPDDVGRTGRIDGADLLMALGELERRGLLRAVGGDAYDFTHDLVRQTAYGTISQPRRKLMHRNIARYLEEASASDPSLAADVAYHATLAENSEAAAQACATAGDRALRLFANVDAENFAERGLRHVARLADSPAKAEVRMALLRVRILAAAGPGMRPLPLLLDAVTEAAKAAERFGLHAALATGHYLLSVLHQEAGNTERAQKSTLRAAAAGRYADHVTHAHQLANTARCLLELETEIGRSRELIHECTGIVEPLGLDLCELNWARGLLQRWDGAADDAITSIGRALALARKDEDRWREYKCLTWLAMLELEAGRHGDVRARCDELKDVAARLGEDETPFVATLQALALVSAGDAAGLGALAEALCGLRIVDDKSYLAYALNNAARLHLDAGRTVEARLCAAEALKAASAMRRNNEMVIARTLLARTEGEGRGRKPASVTLEESEWEGLSARARSARQKIRR